jgi:hypothetical protein
LLTRDDLINKLKQNLDVSLVGQQPREWIEYINSGEYEKAYARFSKGIDSAFLTMVLSEFRTYYTKQIGLIEIKSLDVVTRGIPETVDNDLVIVAVVDILTPRALELYRARIAERAAAAAAAAAASGGEGGDADTGDGGEAADSGAADDAAPADSGETAAPAAAGMPTATPTATPGGGETAAETTPAATPSTPPAATPSTPPAATPSTPPAATPYASSATAPTPPPGDGTPDDETDGGLETAGAIIQEILRDGDALSDESEDSIFKSGENQLFFLLNYKKEANDWEIIKIVQKLQ